MSDSDKLQGFGIENTHLKKAVEILKSRNAILARALETLKTDVDSI